MKSFDRYSVRGLVMTVAGLAGMIYEIVRPRPAETFVLIMYGVVLSLGQALIFFIREK